MSIEFLCVSSPALLPVGSGSGTITSLHGALGFDLFFLPCRGFFAFMDSKSRHCGAPFVFLKFPPPPVSLRLVTSGNKVIELHQLQNVWTALGSAPRFFMTQLQHHHFIALFHAGMQALS